MATTKTDNRTVWGAIKRDRDGSWYTKTRTVGHAPVPSLHSAISLARKLRTVVVALAILMATSCVTTPRSKSEVSYHYLTKASKPVTVLSVSNPDSPYASVMFIDAKGKIFTIDGAALWSFKPGDVIYK